jgi:hypothetical protein
MPVMVANRRFQGCLRIRKPTYDTRSRIDGDSPLFFIRGTSFKNKVNEGCRKFYQAFAAVRR